MFAHCFRTRIKSERQVFLLLAVIDNKLRHDDIQKQPQLDESTINLAPSDFICICEDGLLGVQGYEAASLEVFFEDEVEVTSELPVADILMIEQSGVAQFIGVGCFDNHVRGFG